MCQELLLLSHFRDEEFVTQRDGIPCSFMSVSDEGWFQDLELKASSE